MFFGNIFLYVCWQIVEKYGNKSAGVFIMRTEDYLTDFYPSFQSILELYYSLAAVNNEANESGKTECTLNLIKIILISLKHPFILFGSSLHNWNDFRQRQMNFEAVILVSD